MLKEVPPHATVVGVPGRVVRIKGEKPDLLQEKCDPNAEEIRALKCRVHKLEAALEKLTGEKYECTQEELFPVPAAAEEQEEQTAQEPAEQPAADEPAGGAEQKAEKEEKTEDSGNE